MFAFTQTTISGSLGRNLKPAALLLTAAMLMGASAHAAPQEQFQAGFAAYMQGQKGDSAAIDKAVAAFTAMLQAEPANPVLMAYAGSATTLQATTTMLPWKKMRYSEDGLAMLDKSLATLTPAHNAVMQHDLPGALDVRFIAANTFLAVPGFMNRAARGAKLLDEVVASPLLAQSPLEFRGAVWMRAAALAQTQSRPADARKFLTEVVNSKAPQADAASAQLKTLAP
ncbi:hypothetical protein [Rhodoferax aquaticus]|uniref:Tetratricopeptide repeat protein n=1 Tax=Rhodoferax aquaticus TaxID=2527691 RepID=A0A515EQT8_9BURK|nr:hypothetical protein [Rhodoferax aquaticus]QDL55024.1 hypothetical protein EXZ61_13090 [Rhodoferax aquaticus]